MDAVDEATVDPTTAAWRERSLLERVATELMGDPDYNTDSTRRWREFLRVLSRQQASTAKPPRWWRPGWRP